MHNRTIEKCLRILTVKELRKSVNFPVAHFPVALFSVAPFQLLFSVAVFTFYRSQCMPVPDRQTE